MFIGRYIDRYNDEYWVEGNSIEQIINNLEDMVSDVVFENIIFFKAEPIKIEKNIEYNII